MIPNHATNEDGLVFQVNPSPRTYDIDYAQKYDAYGTLNSDISHLRLGYVLGTLGYVPKSILDVGYGNGAFLKVCTSLIENCYGFDISGFPVPAGAHFSADWLNEQVDVATFFDSLEHFTDPYVIANCHAKYIIGSLPWFHNYSDEWFTQWKHYRPNEHLWYFNPYSLANFAHTIGYELINFSNVEDVVRKPVNDDKNILSFAMRRR